MATVRSISTADLSHRLQTEHRGPSRLVIGVESLDRATEDHLAVCVERRYLDDVIPSKAGALLVTRSLLEKCESKFDGGLLICGDEEGRVMLSRLLRVMGELLEPRLPQHSSGIHETAVVDPTAQIHPTAQIGAFSVIGARVSIAGEVRIGPHVIIEEDATIGERAALAPRVTLLRACVIERDAWVGVGAVIGGRGFGLDEHGRLPHHGRAVIGAESSIGALTCVDRATLGETRIGSQSHLDNLVQVGHNVTLERGVTLCAQVGLSGGATLEEGVRIGGQAGVNNRVRIGAYAQIAAQSGVTRSLSSNERYSGHPAEPNRTRLKRIAQHRRDLDGTSIDQPPERAWIHPEAHVHPSALIHPTAVVGAGADIGPECVLEPYAVVGPLTTLGAGCHVCSFAVVGAWPQARTLSLTSSKFESAHLGPPPALLTAPTSTLITLGVTPLVCGPQNRFHEGVTLSLGTRPGGQGRIGARNLFMAHVHLGHDVTVGDDCVLANNASVAGHVQIGDHVQFGGHAAAHQFTQIGDLAFIAANSMVSGDVPPYCLVAGDRATLRGLNTVGLRRAGVSTEDRTSLKRAFHELRSSTPSNNAMLEGVESSALLKKWVDFFSRSERGICKVYRSVKDHS